MICFSIIVPVYNVETYLTQCVDSILEQSINNFEIILVNDGSTDNSANICDEYADKYTNVSVIHKSNGGLSDARNTGLQNAIGEYIVFVDSDDYIETGALESFGKIIEESNNPDVIITRIKKVNNDSEIRFMDKNMPIEEIKNGSKEEIINWMFNYSDSLWPSVRYIIKRSFIEKNALKFLVGYFHEDIDWSFNLFIKAKTFTGVDYYWYNHRISRYGSITNTKSSKRTLDVIDIVGKNIKKLENNDNEVVLKNIMCERILKTLFSNLSNYKFYGNEEKRSIVVALNNNKDIFKYSVEYRHRLFVLISDIFGFNISLLLMGVLHKV